ncbi:TonB family protein [Gemmatimonadota bacterium DH-20]|uniref:TonB family protein n=1 Tax=Gaopeijia maritima TaxID=3119007 RepID=A0ABU9EAX7_9BACT
MNSSSSSSPSPLPGLPPDLAELDAELSRFGAAERPSFAPELESELEEAWVAGPPRTPGRLRRRLVAATITGLLVVGAAVPPARASLADGLDRLLDAFRDPAPAMVVTADRTSPLPRDVRPASVPASAAAPRAEESTVEVESLPIAEVVESPDELPAFVPARVTYPTLIDEDADRRVIRDFYPPEMQRAGVGGTVGLLLWVAEDGSVDHLRVQGTSGVPALDRAALQGAGTLRFHPATRDGRPVGTYVEFDLVFTPAEPTWVAPHIDPVAAPVLPAESPWSLGDEGPLAIVVPQKLRMEARELLVLAVGDPAEEIEARLGPIDGLLAGEPPAGASPLRWRDDAIRELERARARDVDNPAPVLALARIRRRQGLRAEARALLERGLERVARDARSVSPELVAELNYELGDVVRESWSSQAGLGVVPETAVEELNCATRDPSGSLVETLAAWNFVCPVALESVLHTQFEPLDLGDVDRDRMLRYFETAVRAVPSHVGANVALLLEGADAGRWVEVLAGARRFVAASQGHPYGLLLEGLALHRLRRSEEAWIAFDRALPSLGAEVAASFRDPTSVDVRRGDDPWRAFDPILLTEVNEREVEHLARAAYAYLRFGGLDSDGARVWLRYGRPIEVRALGTTKLRTEFWDFGTGPDLTFTRAGAAVVRRFTPEAAAYLDELRGVFPQWYGTRARTLYELPAQLARYRGDGVGQGMAEVHLQVPGALRQEAGDSVEVGLFVVANDGARRAAERRWTRDPSVTLRAAFGPEAAELVVEVYDPHTRQAAGVRAPAFSDDMVTGFGGLSDLLLVRPAANGSREAVPFARPEVLVGDPVAAAFEVYDLATDREWRMRVEFDSETSEARWSVPFRATAGSSFERERRIDAQGARTLRESLELDLAEVPPDIYTVRVVIEAPDGARIVEEIAGMRVRSEDSEPESGLPMPRWDIFEGS